MIGTVLLRRKKKEDETIVDFLAMLAIQIILRFRQTDLANIYPTQTNWYLLLFLVYGN